MRTRKHIWRYLLCSIAVVLGLCVFFTQSKALPIKNIFGVLHFSPPQLIKAQSTAAFLDSIGVNTHMGTPSTGPAGTNYGNPVAIAEELKFAGIKHVRDDLSIGSYLPALLQLNSIAGARFDLAYGYYASNGGSSIISGDIANVQGSVAIIESIEGPNEPDEFGIYYDGAYSAPNGSTGAAAVISTQKLLYSGVRANPSLHAIPVFCPAFSYPASAGPRSLIVQTGNLASYCDYAPLHAYVENHSLGTFLPYQFLQKWAGFPNTTTAIGRPEIISEGGWPTSPDSQTGVDASTQAKYTIEYLLDAFSLGMSRTYLYQLTDDVPNPPSNLDINNYGLFYYKGIPKPAASALHNIQLLLEGTAGAAGSLSYSVDGLPAISGHQLLMQKDANTFVLVLWNEGVLWDRAARA